MAKLQTEENVKQIWLPTYQHLPEADRAWVKINIDVNVGDSMRIINGMSEDEAKSLTKYETNILGLVSAIIDWNFEDETGKLPITLANIKKMKLADFGVVMAELGLDQGNMDDSKKKRPPRISPVETQRLNGRKGKTKTGTETSS